MSRESDLRAVTAQAGEAFRTGQMFFVARLKLGAWGMPGHGEIAAWGESLQAIEAAGWVLDRWSVSSDSGGGLNAFPVFRRGSGPPTSQAWPTPPQDRT
jgi:hypothetical protein